MPRLIIIVDDSPQIADSLEVALEALSDLKVAAASSGEEALKLINSTDVVAAVITDLEMPRMDGFELIKKIRSLNGRHFPIIVTSGNAHPDAPSQARTAGADAYFTKPYSPSALRGALEDLLAQGA
jgi:CheY-like chemotaxis protein